MTNKPNLELTTTQRNALEAFGAWHAKYGAPPSVRQFAAKLGISPTAAHYLLGALRDKGYIGSLKVITERKLTAKGRREL